MQHSSHSREQHPPHFFVDNSWCFITAATLGRQNILCDPDHRTLLATLLFEFAERHSVELGAWVVLNDHYHILGKYANADQLRVFIQRLHGRTSFELNRRDKTPGRRVWHNYWDRVMRDEQDFWTRFNYIHHNPVKHGYVATAADWPHSSYRSFEAKYGTEWMHDIELRYPIKDFSEAHEDI